MINALLNRAILAMNNAGFEVVGFSNKRQPLKLKVMPAEKLGEFGHKPEKANAVERGGRTIGETCNLERYFGANDWRHAFRLVQDYIGNGPAEDLNLGDFIRVKFDVPAASYDGVKFPALHVDGKVLIVEAEDGKALFNFDEIIFKSAINARDTNKGGFSETALAKYLNNEFLDAMGISDVLLANKDGQRISLPTAYELFGEDDERWAPETNFFDEDDPSQLSYFRQIKNRIKVWEDDTHWYWTSSVRASSAAHFAHCNNYGYSSGSYASAVGGVAPLLCVAKATLI